MVKKKYYNGYRFTNEIIEKANTVFCSFTKEPKEPYDLQILKGNEEWHYDSFEEFLVEYPKADEYWFDNINNDHRLIIRGNKSKCTVSVQSNSREEIQKIFALFEKQLDKSKIIIEKKQPKIFIGHGQSEEWKKLKDYLQEKMGFEVIAYEIGPRAGASVKDILEDMLQNSSVAFLVLTGDDIDNEGRKHARENVIHELGLFQGRLGFEKAIAMLERGVSEFSNILGINQIRFNKENINEAFGDVVAIIKREFE